MSGATRPIAALSFPDLSPNRPDSAPPRIIEVDPADLHVDETYQRNLSERSRALIRKIYAGWDWRAFKPPVVAEVGGEFHVIDGQHTAIAAASHPHVGAIPVLVVEASALERAASFVKHNRDRINATPLQIFHAQLAAADEDAQTIAQCVERAGVRLLKCPPGNGIFQPGDTVAVSTMRGVLSRRYAMGLRRVLQICREARLAPISAAAMRAVENVLFADEFDGEYAESDITDTLRFRWAEISAQGAAFSAQHKLPLWRGLAVEIGRRTRRKRGTARKAAGA